MAQARYVTANLTPSDRKFIHEYIYSNFYVDMV